MFPQYPEKVDVTPEEHQRCNQLMNSLIGKVCATKKVPDILYHYTTPAGFKGIVESGVLRATHVAYTNDGIEHLHAVQVLRSCVSDRRKAAGNAQEKTLLLGMEQGLTDTTSFNTLPIFISCFCEDSDLLSQWRGYGLGEGGIAIGFDTTKMLASLTGWQTFLTPVLYEDGEQQRLAVELLNGIICEYEATLKSRTIVAPEKHLSDFLTVLSVNATTLAPLFKHNGFTEENEWRLIHTAQNLGEVQFFAKSTYLSPVVELLIGTKRPDGKDLLPIKEVWFGPGRYQEHALHSCSSLLSAFGYFGIPLRQSTTPFRSIA
jgi:hypothetical protein